MIKKATPQDYGQLIKLFNKTFNKRFNKRFPNLLPKLYKDKPYIANNHYYIEEDGKFVAGLALIPNLLMLNNDSLKCGGIGMVSVSKKCRGKGYMSKMIEHCVTNNKDIDLMYLSGHRQRYEHFGFVPSGNQYRFTFFKFNAKYITSKDNFTFVKLKNTPNSLQDIIALDKTRAFRYYRDAAIMEEILASWNNKTIVVFKNGEFWGYINTAKVSCNVDEVLVKGDLTQVLAAYFNKITFPCLTVVIGGERTDDVAELASFAQNTSIGYPAAFKICNYENVISKLLTFKGTLYLLAEGELNLKIADTTYLIAVKDNKAAVSVTNNTPDITVGTSEAITLLLGLTSKVYPKMPLVASWFPLPINLPHLDNV